MYKNIAKIEPERVNPASETPTTAGRLKRVKSSIGSRCRHSARRKTASSAAAPISRPTMSVLPQPSSGPRTRATTSMTSAPEKEESPIQSTRRVLGALDSCTRNRVISTARTPIGTLT
jgi:hypothetical protein